MTQAELAADVGTEKAFISNIECGRIYVPAERIAAFAEALRLDARRLAAVLLFLRDPKTATLVWPGMAAMFEEEHRAAARHDAGVEQPAPDLPASEITDPFASYPLD